MDSKSTDAVTLLSSVHGRDRRSLRKIGKRDLQAAVKHGTKELQVCRRAGPHYLETRYKYTFADIVYITDETSTKEITSWVKPYELHPLVLTENDLKLHENVSAFLKLNPQACTSHTVLIVDQSGSMRTCDVKDFKTRSDATLGCLALDFVGKQLDGGSSGGTDVVSLIFMNDEATVVFEREPITNVLYNKLINLQKTIHPHSHGNYIPALLAAEKLLIPDKSNSKCAMLLLFLSDGRPSDITARSSHLLYNANNPYNPFLDIVRNTQAVVAGFGQRLSFCTIGCADSEADFLALELMAHTAKQAGCQAKYAYMGNSAANLSAIITGLSSRLSATRSHLTSMHAAKGRTLRAVQREQKPTGLQSKYISNDDAKDWEFYENFVRWTYDPRPVKRGWPWKEEKPLFGSRTNQVAMRKKAFGQGVERIVFQFTEVAHHEGVHSSLTNQRVGHSLVAKESLYVIKDEKKKIEFHQVFCKTQRMAGKLAEAFNDRLVFLFEQHQLDQKFLCKIRFLECSVYTFIDHEHKYEKGVLVEKMLEGDYTKWNSNNGYVEGGRVQSDKMLDLLAVLAGQDRDKDEHEEEVEEPDQADQLSRDQANDEDDEYIERYLQEEEEVKVSNHGDEDADETCQKDQVHPIPLVSNHINSSNNLSALTPSINGNIACVTGESKGRDLESVGAGLDKSPSRDHQEPIESQQKQQECSEHEQGINNVSESTGVQGVGSVTKQVEEKIQEKARQIISLIKIRDFPQAFSHFSYRHTSRKMLVCDLQGVVTTTASPTVFEFTDPVIHYASMSQSLSRARAKRKFGRTDLGKKGINKFFKTHECNAVCYLLGLVEEEFMKRV